MLSFYYRLVWFRVHTVHLVLMLLGYPVSQQTLLPVCKKTESTAIHWTDCHLFWICIFAFSCNHLIFSCILYIFLVEWTLTLDAYLIWVQTFGWDFIGIRSTSYCINLEGYRGSFLPLIKISGVKRCQPDSSIVSFPFCLSSSTFHIWFHLPTVLPESVFSLTEQWSFFFCLFVFLVLLSY